MMQTEEKHLKDLKYHHKAKGFGDHFAFALVKFLRFFADAFFKDRYGHRAVVLETIAAVPGMVGGTLLHLKSLRRMKDDEGWIHTLLAEAENERMHLMTFIEIARPTFFERMLVMIAQSIFYAGYFVLHLISSKTAHRMVGYLEEEAVASYTEYLELIEAGQIENVPAPEIAKKYWDLDENAKLSDVVWVIRADEIKHREVNHCMADKIEGKKPDIKFPDHTRSDAEEDLEEIRKREKP